MAVVAATLGHSHPVQRPEPGLASATQATYSGLVAVPSGKVVDQSWNRRLEKQVKGAAVTTPRHMIHPFSASPSCYVRCFAEDDDHQIHVD